MEVTPLILKAHTAYTPVHHFLKYTSSFSLLVFPIINYWFSHQRLLVQYRIGVPNIKGSNKFNQRPLAEFYPLEIDAIIENLSLLSIVVVRRPDPPDVRKQKEATSWSNSDWEQVDLDRERAAREQEMLKATWQPTLGAYRRPPKNPSLDATRR